MSSIETKASPKKVTKSAGAAFRRLVIQYRKSVEREERLHMEWMRTFHRVMQVAPSTADLVKSVMPSSDEAQKETNTCRMLRDAIVQSILATHGRKYGLRSHESLAVTTGDMTVVISLHPNDSRNHIVCVLGANDIKPSS